MNPIRFTLDAGPHARRWCPISATFGVDAAPTKPVHLRDLNTDLPMPLPVQTSLTPDGKLTARFIVDSIATGEVRTYELVESDEPPPGASGVRVKARQRDECVEVRVGRKLFTTYHHGRSYARPFLYPLNEPGGACVTRGWPIIEGLPGETTDHKHHKSCWVAWGDVNGVDNWSEEPGHGRQVHREFVEISDGPVCGVIHAKNDWVDASGKKQLEEDRRITVYAGTPQLRIVDFEITFRMTESEVRFGDTKEGGLVSVRVATSMDGDKGGTLTNAYGGVGEGECWGKRAHWVDYFGPVGGKVCGIALLDHPDNVRHPTYWHIRNYGLMTANPFGVSHFRGKGFDGSMVFAAGTSQTWRYRMLVHRGDARRADVAGHYLDYIAPPRVTRL